MHEVIRNMSDTLSMLDAILAERGGAWWDRFYTDRTRPIPFFVNAPDESLAGFFESGQLGPGVALELGCGPGRNAIYLAQRGCVVDAVDFSKESIRWAKERAGEAGVTVNFICASVFDVALRNESYDLVYDAGCLHHIPPHRRWQYLELVSRVLKPDGMFGLVCLTPEGGTDFTDWEVYRQRSMGGGLGYTEERLRHVLAPRFEVVELRKMKDLAEGAPCFGRDFLWVALIQKKVTDGCEGARSGTGR